MTEKELIEQERKRVRREVLDNPVYMELFRAVYNQIWGGSQNDTATNSK